MESKEYYIPTTIEGKLCRFVCRHRFSHPLPLRTKLCLLIRANYMSLWPFCKCVPYMFWPKTSVPLKKKKRKENPQSDLNTLNISHTLAKSWSLHACVQTPTMHTNMRWWEVRTSPFQISHQKTRHSARYSSSCWYDALKMLERTFIGAITTIWSHCTNYCV